MERFGDLLREFRKRARCTQKELAEMVGMSFNHLNQIENGKRSAPRREKVLALASDLQLTREETDNLLFSAGYAPLNTVYRSPLKKNEISSVQPDGISDSASGETSVSTALKSVEDLLMDPTLSEDQKKLIGEEITSFAGWLKQKVKSKERM